MGDTFTPGEGLFCTDCGAFCEYHMVQNKDKGNQGCVMAAGNSTGMGNLHGLWVWVGMGTGMGHDSMTCNPCLPITKIGAMV